MKPVVVSFASHGREQYNKGTLRLINTVNSCVGDDYDMLLWSLDGYTDKYEHRDIILGNGSYPRPKRFVCHSHNAVPYLFKLAMIELAREKGYEKIIWMDSTTVLVKRPTELFALAAKQGIVVFDNLGHPLAPYIHDMAINNLKATPEELNTMPQIMACVIMWDFSVPAASEIFDEWLANAPSFQNANCDRPGYISHRHDQCVLSVILNRRGIKFLPYGQGLVYEFEGKDDTRYGNDFCFVNRGLR